MTNSQIKKIYTIYYPQWIYDLITNQKCTYEWLNICDYKFINASGKDEKDFNLKGNPFITDAIKKDKKELGLDILKNGMYFPFFCIESENKQEKKILFGKHRLMSLRQCPYPLIQNKKFLFITFPVKAWPELLINKELSNTFLKSYKIVNNEQFILSKVKNKSDYFKNFLNFSDTLPSLVGKYRDDIVPLEIFNNEQIFLKWINENQEV